MVLLLAGVTLAFSCKKDEENPQQNPENELITTVTLHLTSPTGTKISAAWRDLTPDDEAGRTIDTLRLTDSTLYTGSVEVLDETKSPVDSITSQVEEEAKDHLFVYKPVAPLTDANLVLMRTDKDVNNLEVGLHYTLETKLAANGALRVILRHQPGEKDGTEVPGDSDVDIAFPVKIQ